MIIFFEVLLLWNPYFSILLITFFPQVYIPLQLCQDSSVMKKGYNKIKIKVNNKLIFINFYLTFINILFYGKPASNLLLYFIRYYTVKYINGSYFEIGILINK